MPGACQGIASRLPGVRHNIFSACEIERRPRGASPASRLPHLFRASYSCTLGARTLGAWLDIDERQRRHLQYRREQTRRAAVNSQERLARNRCGSRLAGDAPRGRRSISRALNNSRHASYGPDATSRHALLRSDTTLRHALSGSTPLQHLPPTSLDQPPVALPTVPVALSSEAVAPL